MMVKGVSKQVIVVQAPQTQMFEQAIFILKDGQSGVSDEALLKEAKRIMGDSVHRRRQMLWLRGLVCAGAGAGVTGLIWLIMALA